MRRRLTLVDVCREPDPDTGTLLGDLRAFAEVPELPFAGSLHLERIERHAGLGAFVTVHDGALRKLPPSCEKPSSA